MSVDISPKRPPISSCTAWAPAGSGSDGGGSSVPTRSIRKITGSSFSGRRRLPGGAVRYRGRSELCPFRADRRVRALRPVLVAVHVLRGVLGLLLRLLVGVARGLVGVLLGLLRVLLGGVVGGAAGGGRGEQRGDEQGGYAEAQGDHGLARTPPI